MNVKLVLVVVALLPSLVSACSSDKKVGPEKVHVESTLTRETAEAVIRAYYTEKFKTYYSPPVVVKKVEILGISQEGNVAFVKATIIPSEGHSLGKLERNMTLRKYDTGWLVEKEDST